MSFGANLVEIVFSGITFSYIVILLVSLRENVRDNGIVEELLQGCEIRISIRSWILNLSNLANSILRSISSNSVVLYFIPTPGWLDNDSIVAWLEALEVHVVISNQVISNKSFENFTIKLEFSSGKRVTLLAAPRVHSRTVELNTDIDGIFFHDINVEIFF